MPITIAPYPVPTVRTSLPSSEWDPITSVYLTAASHLLHLQTPQFLSETNNNHSISAFLLSYISHADPDAATSGLANDQLLRKKVFQLLHRLLTQSPKPPADLYASDRFLFGLARCYGRSAACRALIKELWEKHEEAMSTAVGKQKAHLCPQLAAGLLSNEIVGSLCRLFLLSPETAAAWCAGDELWEAAAEAEDKTAVKVTGRAALEAVKINWSVVTDALLALLSSKARQQKALIEGLVKFGVVERLQTLANDTEAEGRIAKIAERVKDMEVKRIRKDKGKEKAADTIDWRQEARAELESKVGAIQDLFPELGAGFVKRALEVLGGDVEVVTSALLEGNLPQELDKLDRGLQESHAPLPTPPSSVPKRRNKYDNDELDLLLPSSSSRLTIGKRHTPQTADNLLSKPTVPKSAILSALAAIDLDDDEHDDTYDAADVGGAIEASTESGPFASVTPQSVSSAKDLEVEKYIYNLWKARPEAFGRSARGTKERQIWKDESGWTDEAIEGWAIMMKREPERERRLERRLRDVEDTAAIGQQNVIESTRWRDGDEETPAGRGRGRGGFRGRGGGGRGRGGGGGHGGANANGSDGADTAGSSKSAGDTARGRGRKEANKGRVANHHRKNQRAKKVARGAFMGGGGGE